LPLSSPQIYYHFINIYKLTLLFFSKRKKYLPEIPLYQKAIYLMVFDTTMILRSVGKTLKNKEKIYMLIV